MAGKYWDVAWNPMTGCTPVSPGCERCWAREMSGRFSQIHGHYMFAGDESGLVPIPFDEPTFHPDRLDAPLHWRKSRRIFLANMGDLFHEAFTDGQILRVFDTMAFTPHHTYMILTKRPERMRNFFYDHREYLGWPWLKVWLGITICNQAEADHNIPILLATPAATKWVSIEPMLSAVYGDHPRRVGYEWGWPDLDLVVLGGETGPGARPMQPEWALDVYRQCKAAGVPFWFKQGGSASLPRFCELGELMEMQATHELPAVTP